MDTTATPRIFETPLYPYARSADQEPGRVAHHPVVVVGAGPVGLAAALDLGQRGVATLVLDDNDKVSGGSRAICYAKRALEILDRLGCGEIAVDKGVTWQIGKVFFDQEHLYTFDLLPETGHKRPAFINLQQYHLEHYLVQRLGALRDVGAPLELRGRNKVTGVTPEAERVRLAVETPDGPYELTCDWLIVCDGAASPLRAMMELDFVGRVFEDNFLIADVVMEADFPTERWFWFDPPFNRGQSALLHKQPDKVWRIDLQLGWDIDKEAEKRPEKVMPRLKAMLGDDAKFELEWISIYTFQCRRMERFRHGRVIFAGDAAHQVSPFGARGANSGFQDTDNLAWKLALVLDGKAPDSLLDSYDAERVLAADENILNSTRATDFITPKSQVSRMFRDVTLELAGSAPFARSLVNSGRLSRPAVYDGSPLNGPDAPGLPTALRPGAPAADAPLADGGWLLDELGGDFVLLVFADGLGVTAEALAQAARALGEDPIAVAVKVVSRAPLEAEGVIRVEEEAGLAVERYGPGSVYLIRPDQHVAARFTRLDTEAVRAAVQTAIGRGST